PSRRTTSPPRSPSPLPYTTLFRSPKGLSNSSAMLTTPPSPLNNWPMPAPSGGQAEAILRSGGSYSCNEQQLRLPGVSHSFQTGGDRKSTRLNSSHVKISYAVFCLK